MQRIIQKDVLTIQRHKNSANVPRACDDTFVATSPSYKRKLTVCDSSPLFYRDFPPSPRESVRIGVPL